MIFFFFYEYRFAFNSETIGKIIGERALRSKESKLPSLISFSESIEKKMNRKRVNYERDDDKMSISKNGQSL